MSSIHTITRLLQFGNPLFLRLTTTGRPGEDMALSELVTATGYHLLDLRGHRDWMHVELGFGLPPDTNWPPVLRGSPRLPAKLLLVISQELTAHQIHLVEYLIQKYLPGGIPSHQFLVVGTEGAWTHWNAHARFYTNSKQEELAGLGLSLVQFPVNSLC